MNLVVSIANQWGASFLHAGATMLWQSSLLALVILALDFGLSRWVRASVRHALWLVLLVKLILPTSFALPTSPAWWWSRRAPEAAQFLAPAAPPSAPTIFDDDAASTRFARSVRSSGPGPLPPLTLAAWTFAVTLAGSLGLLAWLLWRYTRVLQLCRLAEGAPDLASLVAEARHLAGLNARVRVKISSGTLSPAVCCLFRPVILLPQSLMEILSPDQLRAIVVHELIHLRRGDVWINCLQGLLQTVYWWHPLVWLANARIRRVREEAVDDAVMVALQEDSEIYAPTLLAVARFALRRPQASPGLVGILESRSALRQRIERLVNLPVPAKAGLSFVSLFGLLLFSAVALPMGDAPPPAPLEMAQTFRPPVILQGDHPAPTPPRSESHPSGTRLMSFVLTGNVGLPKFRDQTGLTSGNSPKEYLAVFRKLLAARGASLPTNSLWLRDQGLLLVRGSPPELAAVESMFQELNRTQRPAQTAAAARPPARADAVVLNQPPAISAGEDTNLYMRTFKMNTNILEKTLAVMGPPLSKDFMTKRVNSADELGAEIRNVFQAMGVLKSPEVWFYNDRLGLLFVRATSGDLDMVERIVESLNQDGPLDDRPFDTIHRFRSY